MIDLSGTWELRDESGMHRVPISIPGDVHTALVQAGVLADPFVGTNEIDVQWVGQRGWTIRRTFTVDRDVLERAGRVLLELDVVDTVAEIFVNDRLVGRSSSMFIPGRYDVGDVVSAGENVIEVRFDSPESAAAERAKNLPYPVPHQVYPHQSMHRNLLRKVQCHSSWDWGIALMVSGVYGGVRLRPAGEAALRSVYAVPRPEGKTAGRWSVPVHIEWDTPDLAPGDCELPAGLPPVSVAVELHDGRGRTVCTRTTDPSGSEPPSASTRRGASTVDVPRRGEVVMTMEVDDPELWWPAGYGAQPLYTITVRWGEEERAFRTAFRTVEVVNRPDEVGASLFFRVNGRDVWAKGTNWIPVDAFPSRQTPAVYRRLLGDTVRANMNMVRVWGGGQYEPDLFYDLCDELGLLVWQDFMFSCSLYPSEDWFLEEVREETAVQTRRLVSHPSVALWCGNNENIGALGWFEESLANPGRYLIDFDRLNNGVIAREVAAVDDTRVFWPSSPAAGEGDFSDNWHDDSAGDMHYWSVWHEGKPFSAYYEVTPRFCSEFGFQSFPSMHTLRSFADEHHLNPTSPQMEHHQRNPRGNTVILETMARYYRVPFGMEAFVYLSQVQQATAIETAVSFWRSRRPVSMGALYWQLNDLWPVVSWSSIEYDGRWKLLHFAARRFFAPRRVVAFRRGAGVEVHVVNDGADAVVGTVRLRVLDWHGREITRFMEPVRVPGDGTVCVWDRPVDALGVTPTEGFAVAEFLPADEADRGEDEPLVGTSVPVDSRGPDHPAVDPVERDVVLLCEYKEAELVAPSITVSVDDSHGAIPTDAPPTAVGRGTRGHEKRRTVGTVEVTCHDAPAFWLTIESADPCVQPEDNGVFMLPGEARRIPVTVVGEYDVDPATIQPRIHAVRTIATPGGVGPTM